MYNPIKPLVFDFVNWQIILLFRITNEMSYMVYEKKKKNKAEIQ